MISGAGSSLASEVLRYDGTTGDFIDVFASGGGLDIPVHLTFGPDNNLYVTSLLTGVLRYNGTTGDFIDVFPSGGGLFGSWPDFNGAVSSGLGIAPRLAVIPA